MPTSPGGQRLVAPDRVEDADVVGVAGLPTVPGRASQSALVTKVPLPSVAA